MKRVTKTINIIAFLLFAAAIVVFAFDRGAPASNSERNIASESPESK